VNKENEYTLYKSHKQILWDHHGRHDGWAQEKGWRSKRQRFLEYWTLHSIKTWTLSQSDICMWCL